MTTLHPDTPNSIAEAVLQRIKEFPRTYDQSRWFRTQHEGEARAAELSSSVEHWNECGTTGCIAGHAVAIAAELGLIEQPSRRDLLNDHLFFPRVATNLLGLNSWQADWLFNEHRGTHVAYEALEYISHDQWSELDDLIEAYEDEEDEDYEDYEDEDY